MRIGDCGLRIGDCGLAIAIAGLSQTLPVDQGPWSTRKVLRSEKSAIRNPQSIDRSDTFGLWCLLPLQGWWWHQIFEPTSIWTGVHVALRWATLPSGTWLPEV